MFEKLADIEKRYEEINEKLADPNVASDLDNYRKLTKERSEIAEIVESYREHNRVANDIEDNKELLATEKETEMLEMVKQELEKLKHEKEYLENKLKVLLLPKDPNDNKNILLEIRAGAGGDEAGLFAADLFRMYGRFAERRKWKIEILSQSATGVGGIKEVIALIAGEQVYSNLKYEGGVHRVQRVPKTEASGRIHTSTCTVAVLPEADEVEVQIDERDLRIDIFRSSGPGGQGVNTTDSAVRITHLPTNMVVQCQDERSQHKNKARALKILSSRLLDLEQKKQNQDRESNRRQMVGTGERSEKIRTYNYPQNRITDHRINLTVHNLQQVLEGDLEEIISRLRTYYQAQALTSNG
ncbi:MAG: peptide chain release factor 1 [Pseudomonadota bacterium]